MGAPLAFLLASLELVADTGGVRVWRRTEAREIELYAEGDIDAPPAAVRAVLLDYERHPKWNSHVAESRILRRDDHSLDVYQRLDLPLLADRDFTLSVTWGETDGVPWLRFFAANDRGPSAKRNAVRITLHEGEWTFQPRDGGRATHARYHVRLDLAGSLPGWMARQRAGEDVPSLFAGVRKMVKN